MVFMENVVPCKDQICRIILSPDLNEKLGPFCFGNIDREKND
jgi:hypothetical protein